MELGQDDTGEPDILASAPGTALLANLVDGVFIIDSRGCIRYANAAAARMFGYDADRLIGAAIETLMPETMRAQHQGYIDRHLATGEVSVIGRGRAVEGVARNGQRLQIHLAVSKFAYCGEQHFIGITHDRTAEAIAAQQLRRSLDRLHRSQRFGKIGSWEWTVGENSIYWSETIGPMFGYTEGERRISFQDLVAAVHPDDRSNLLAAIDACIEGGAPCRVEHRVVWPDGTVRWLIEEGDIERDAAGEARRMLGVVRDITSRKAMDAALLEAKETAERATRAQADFISSMSHEIRTPLNTILGYAALLKANGTTPETAGKIARYADSILDSGQHLLTIINDILDLALIESGRLAVTMGPTDIGAVLGEAGRIVDLMAERKSIIISTELPPEPLSAMADAGRLRQVLVNLLSNAVKYNVEHGRVFVRAGRVDGRKIRLEVEDTGSGIAQERHDDVFKRFNRLGAEQSNIEGAGIGLALSKHLVAAMDGSIGFFSEAARGSRFWIELHASPHDRMPPRATDAPTVPVPGYRGPVRRMLVVEDNPLNFEILREVLMALGDFAIDWARHAREVPAKIADARPDLIFLDINLPDEDGFAVARLLRGLLGTYCPPIVGLSANAYDQVRQQALDLGFAAYIVKPFRIDGIRAALDLASTRETPGNAR